MEVVLLVCQCLFPYIILFLFLILAQKKGWLSNNLLVLLWIIGGVTLIVLIGVFAYMYYILATTPFG